jgi:hypothetical protein
MGEGTELREAETMSSPQGGREPVFHIGVQRQHGVPHRTAGRRRSPGDKRLRGHR